MGKSITRDWLRCQQQQARRASLLTLLLAVVLLATSCTTSVTDETSSPLRYDPPINSQSFAVRVQSSQTIDNVEIVVPGVGADAMVDVGDGRYEADMIVPTCAGAVEFTVNVETSSTKQYPPAGAFTHEVTDLPAECAEFADVVAATFNVDAFDDFVDINPGDGVCSGGPENLDRCSLRAAVMEANVKSGNDLIQLPVGRYTLSLAGDEDGLGVNDAIGDLDITDSVTVQGNSVGSVAAWDFLIEANNRTENLTDDPARDGAFVKIDGGAIDRVFQVQAGATLQLREAAIMNGRSNDIGGGIHNAGTTTMERVAVVGNVVAQADTRRGGGGIWNDGLLIVDQSLLAHNEVGGSVLNPAGGAIFNVGTAEITRTLMAYNSARFGNAVVNAGDGSSVMTLENVTLYDHKWGNGDPVSVVSNGNEAAFVARYTTVAKNWVGRALLLSNTSSGAYTVANSLVIDNSARYCSNTISSAGGNVMDEQCALISPLGDLDHIEVSTVPAWGSLQDEGGFTPVYTFTPPASGTTTLFDATDRAVFGRPFTDQRGEGFDRSVDGNGDGESRSDPGAYEYRP